LLVVRSADDVLAALDKSDAELRAIAHAARERVLAEHTSKYRTQELLAILSHAMHRTQISEPRMASGG
jgi:spore maturation protein CgeB